MKLLALLAIIGSASPDDMVELHRVAREATGQWRQLRVTLELTRTTDKQGRIRVVPIAGRTKFSAGSLIPAGAVVQIENIELPFVGHWYTPRHKEIYVTLRQPGRSLRLDILPTEPWDLTTILESYLGGPEIRARLNSVNDFSRTAVETGTLHRGMPKDVLEMSFGPPDSRTLSLDKNVKIEKWTYLNDAATVTFRDGVIRREGTTLNTDSRR